MLHDHRANGVARRVVIAALAGFAAVALACRGTTPIRDLIDDPGRWDGETVRVKGEVTQSYGAIGRGAYRIDDGTGEINVVNRTGGAPREGARVGIEGVFHSVFTFGDRSEAVIVEEDRFDP